MKKPVPQDFGVSEQDLCWFESVKSCLLVSTILAVLIPGLVLGVWLKKSLGLVFALFVPPVIPLILYYSLRGVAGIVSKRFRSSMKFKAAEVAYKDWSIRMRKEFWLSLNGIQFENEMANLYRQRGYKVELTPPSNDHGVDIWIIKDGLKTPVQCKAHKKAVGPGALRDFYGAMKHFGSERGVFVSTSGFTSGAREYAAGKAIRLIELRIILEMQNDVDPVV